jgi:hypothetical protein
MKHRFFFLSFFPIFLTIFVLVDEKSPVWTKIQTRGDNVQCRAFHSGVFLNNKIYIFGGCNKAYGNWQFPNYIDYFDFGITLYFHSLVHLSIVLLWNNQKKLVCGLENCCDTLYLPFFPQIYFIGSGYIW